MSRRKWCLAAAGACGLVAAAAASGCSDGARTTGSATKPPEAEAGEKASYEFMKKNMGRGGMTKPTPAPNP